MTAHVVMVGARVRAVLTDAANNGDSKTAAAEVARQVAAALADEPQDLARAAAVWIVKSPHLDGQDVEVPLPRESAFPKAPAAFYDTAMVEGLARAAELLERKDGGSIWDSTSRAALDHARVIGIVGRDTKPANDSPPGLSAGTVASSSSCALDASSGQAPRVAPARPLDDLLDGLLACAHDAIRRRHSPVDAALLVRAYIDLRAATR